MSPFSHFLCFKTSTLDFITYVPKYFTQHQQFISNCGIYQHGIWPLKLVHRSATSVFLRELVSTLSSGRASMTTALLPLGQRGFAMPPLRQLPTTPRDNVQPHLFVLEHSVRACVWFSISHFTFSLHRLRFETLYQVE